MPVKISDLAQQSNVKFGTSGLRALVSDLSNEVCFGYTTSFLRALGVSGGKVVIGHDLRPSSPEITRACATAVADQGGEVVYAGMLPTPAVAWYGMKLGAPSVVVTGSHIPFDRNGIKFYRAEGEISKEDEQKINGNEIAIPPDLNPADLPSVDEAARDYYMQRYTDFFEPDVLAGVKVAVYEHSSVARDVLRTILERLGAKVVSLGRTETFVPIDTEAVRPEDVEQARLWADEIGFDALLSTDGDSDRPLIGDEKGQWFRGDIVGILVARFLGADTIAAPVSCNTAVEKCKWFSEVRRTRIGSPYVISAMEDAATDGSVVAGYEANGGFLLGSDVTRQGKTLGALPTRDAVLPMLCMLVMAREKGVPLSQLTKELPQRYTASNRLTEFPTERSRELIARFQTDQERLVEVLNPGCIVASIDTTDGLRVTFEGEDVVHLRPSGNAPELRCYTESGTPAQAEALCVASLQKLDSLR